MLRSFTLALCVGGASIASTAGAQITITPLTPSETDFVTRGFNKRDCDTNAEVRLQLAEVPDASFVVFFRGDSCEDVMRRDGTSTVAQCTRLFAVERTSNRFEVDEQRLRNYVDCSEGSSAIHVFAIASEGSAGTEEVSTEEWGSIDFKLDILPPSAPDGLSGGRGGSTVGVPFEPVTSVLNYRLYVDAELSGPRIGTDAGPGESDAGSSDAGGDDAGGSDAGSGDAGSLDASAGSGGGAGVCPDDSWLRTGDPDGSGTNIAACTDCTATVDLSAVPIGSTVAVAITAQDEAGNESAFSNVVCVTRVQTGGHCDEVRRRGGKCEGCSAGGSGDAALAALVLGIAIVSRRRRWPAR
jgi:uncharacterized protein (TIGR03382 family)